MKGKRNSILEYNEIYELSYEIYEKVDLLTHNSDIPPKIKGTFEDIKRLANQVLNDLTANSHINSISEIMKKKSKKIRDRFDFYRNYGWVW